MSSSANEIRKEIAVKYFNNQVDYKQLKKFTQKTPQGNIVSGYLCMQEGPFLSSMVLLDVQLIDKDRHIKLPRFIRGMPKQRYYDKGGWSLQESEQFTLYPCYEKLDGTCLILYTLYDDEDKLIEIVPRTRGMAVAANHIIDMFNLVDQARIREFYSVPHQYDYVLMFELYGILNRHEITYHQYYIDIRLIGASLEREMLTKQELLSIAFNSHFNVPDLLFNLCSYDGVWRIWEEISRVSPYIDKKQIHNVTYDSLQECIEGLEQIMEEINQNYEAYNGHIAIEGVVINGRDENENQRYVKIKPFSVLKMAKLGNGIPGYVIRKEVYKYFDEYGIIKVKEIYNKDKLHFLKFIQRNLIEEFPEDLVLSGKTTKKITKIFFNVWESRTPDLTVQKICQELADRYPNEKL